MQVIPPSEEGCEDLGEGDVDLKYLYNAVTDDQLTALTNFSVYCTQDMIYHCNNAHLNLYGRYGWYSHDGSKMSRWAGRLPSKSNGSIKLLFYFLYMYVAAKV